MALSELQKICDTIRERWQVIHIALYHRIGVVPILETSVFVAVSSIHRKDSLEACHVRSRLFSATRLSILPILTVYFPFTKYAIDEIKAAVPVWKKEFYEDGSTWKENQEFRDRHKC